MGGRYSGESAWRRSRIVLPVASPAAGADWSLVVPAGHLYQLHSVFAILTTSAVVANRLPRLAVSDGVASFLELPAAAVQAASAVVRYSWAGEASSFVAGGSALGALVPLDLIAGWFLGPLTSLIDVGDQWSGIRVYVTDVTVRGGEADIGAVPDLVVEVAAPAPS